MFYSTGSHFIQNLIIMAGLMYRGMVTLKVALVESSADSRSDLGRGIKINQVVNIPPIIQK